MEKFKIGDRVFQIVEGWGTISKIVFRDKYEKIEVEFDNKVWNTFTHDYIKLLSFTEYTLQGFTQERSIELPEVGELCLVRDEDFKNWHCEYFVGVENGLFYTKNGYNETSEWMEIKRIKILD